MEPRPQPGLAPAPVPRTSGGSGSGSVPELHYRDQPALWQRDTTPDGFRWIDADDAAANVLSFIRYPDHGSPLACIANLSPVPRHRYRIGLPVGGEWRELLNTDDVAVGGSGVTNGAIHAESGRYAGLDFSVELVLPPLAVLWLVPAWA